MKCRLFTLLVTIISCAGVFGCSTSKWVTDNEAEFIREGTKTVLRPVLSIVRYPEDKPELIVQVSQELSGQRVREERKHEQIHKIWEPNILSFGVGLFGLGASPFYILGNTLMGNPAKGFEGLKYAVLSVVGFEGIYQQDRQGESTIEVTPTGIGTEIVPWGNAPVELNVERMPPIKKLTDQTGKLVIDLKALPMDTVHPREDLHLTVSTEANGVAAQEKVTIPVLTVMSWPAKEEEFARREQERLIQIARRERENKEQEERQAVAKREREAQEAREARTRAEYERQHPEIAYAREAEATAQNQCAQCKSRCDDQALPCTAACFGNLADTMCIARCQVALDTCNTGCEERRDALIAKAWSASPSSVGSTCDVLAEDREIETMEKRLLTEMKGLGKKKRECYAAKQYVKIAQFRIRAAARCNLDPAEPQRYLQDVEVQEREFCQGLSMK